MSALWRILDFLVLRWHEMGAAPVREMREDGTGKNMKKLPYTPNGKIKAALRMLFLRSRERAAALKRDKYTCQKCGVKQSRAKGKEVFVEAHHVEGVCNWQEIYECVRKNLLCDPELIETLCIDCHREHEAANK